ncbi:pilus assembly protein Flp/PilA [Acidiphilium sp. MT5]
MLTKLWNDKRGVTAIEYGLIAALIAVAIIGILSAVGTSLKGVFSSVNTQLSTAAGGGAAAG